jgi:hypothetical protein
MMITPKINKDIQKFSKLLDQCLYAEKFFNLDGSAEVDLERLADEIGDYSSGEQIMLRFLVGVFCGENKLDFDFVKASKILDQKNLNIISTWVKDPFFP